MHIELAQAQAPAERPRIVDYRPMAAKSVPAPGDICTLHPGPARGKIRILPRRRPGGKAAQTATIEVEYSGFTDEAQEAFQRAVDIWESHIESSVTIKVEAEFTQMDAGVLGSAGPEILWFGTTEDGQQSIYPDALIDALLGENAAEADDESSNDDAPDIFARFNSEANWYFGPPEPGPGFSEVDFTTVVLHELGHGLGFFGSMQVSDAGTSGSWGFGTSDPAVPAIYDRFAEDGNSIELIDESTFPNPSLELADVLQSDNVFFSGPESDVGAAVEPGPVPPKLYLPPEWDPGSSYSHVEEDIYGTGEANALMTPRIASNEVVHDPGSIMCGMFSDMGWELGPGCAAYFDVEVVNFESATSGEGGVELTWAETRAADVAQYEIEQQYFDEPPEIVETIASEGPMRYTVPLDGLDVGEYVFALYFIRPNGDRVQVDESEITVPLRTDFELAEIYPNPFSQRANIKLTVRRAQNFRVEVFNALGQRVAVLYDQERPANDPRPITFDAANLGTLPSGRYFFRVIGERFEETRSAVFVR